LSVRRHPSATLLADYAAGRLALAAGLSLAAHMDGCRHCRARVVALEAQEGEVLADGPDATLAPDALGRALARLDDPAPPSPTRKLDRLGDVVLPSVVAHLGLKSRRWVAPGFWAARVNAPSTDGWRTFLLRAPAGARIPHHEHGGVELIYVISGAFRDGVDYEAGDFAEHSAESEHDLTVFPDGPCACLISLQGTTRWKGWSRVIVPILGV
jgi:putative transcriptional regulator